MNCNPVKYFEIVACCIFNVFIQYNRAELSHAVLLWPVQASTVVGAVSYLSTVAVRQVQLQSEAPIRKTPAAQAPSPSGAVIARWWCWEMESASQSKTFQCTNR